MDYAIAGLAGLSYGALIGVIKYLLLWKPLLLGTKELNNNRLLIAQMVSMIVNAAVLFSVFLLREIWPYSFTVTLIATALGLVLARRITTLYKSKHVDNSDQQQVQDVKEDDSDQESGK